MRVELKNDDIDKQFKRKYNYFDKKLLHNSAGRNKLLDHSVDSSKATSSKKLFKDCVPVRPALIPEAHTQGLYSADVQYIMKCILYILELYYTTLY